MVAALPVKSGVSGFRSVASGVGETEDGKAAEAGEDGETDTGQEVAKNEVPDGEEAAINHGRADEDTEDSIGEAVRFSFAE
ncbi:MAG: hypothetical protein RL648_260 [Verrucomicrobiota bacterium]